MKTYPNGSKCSEREMKKIISERNEMEYGRRRLHSPEVTAICRREVERFLETRAVNVWEHEDWVLDVVQQDLGFTDAQIKTQLKNLCKYEIIEKQLIRVPGKRQVVGSEYRHLHKRW